MTWSTKAKPLDVYESLGTVMQLHAGAVSLTYEGSDETDTIPYLDESAYELVDVEVVEPDCL